MITKMKKLTFLVYHKEYDSFLKSLRDLGIVHVQEFERGVVDDSDMQAQLLKAKQVSDAIKRLARLDIEKNANSGDVDGDGESILLHLEELERKAQSLKQSISSVDKTIESLTPWGNFTKNDIQRLNDLNLDVNFYMCNESSFDEAWIGDYNATIIQKDGSRLYFITLTEKGVQFFINAESVRLPEVSLVDAVGQLEKLNAELDGVENEIKLLASNKLDSLEAYLLDLEANIEFDKVLLNTKTTVENKLMVLQGWIPANETVEISEKLDQTAIYYEISDPTPDDCVPIKFANKGFFSWFEPIGKLYMLPKYNEIDLTPYFAPFFMVFFGLCLGDSGYGAFLFIAATLYKMFAKSIKPAMKGALSLVQVLGVSALFCGLLTGGFFGVNLYDIDIPFVQKLKSLVFLDNDKMFNLALILGVIQILFGMLLKIANQVIQFGFKYAVATIGWFVLLVYTFLLAAFPVLGALGSTPHLIVCGISAAMIFLYNSPDKNIFINIGLGLWDTYNMATGLLGDILSYVRLFALGLSGSILASVFNTLAADMSPDNIVFGPIVMVLIFVIGHAINIFMNVLGAMVHPMRLTFVEFFKSAGYEGGGQEYKPFRNK